MKDSSIINGADLRVKLAMDEFKNYDNEMGLFLALTGGGAYKLEQRPGLGHDYYSILEAIYRYHKENPNDRIDQLLNKVLKIFSQISVNIPELSRTINIIFAQLNNQKNGKSPFEIELMDILKVLRDKISNSAELLNNKEYMDKLTEYDEMLDSKYGHKIL